MDTGYPSFIPEPYSRPSKSLKPYKPGKSRSNSKGEHQADQKLGSEKRNALRESTSSTLPKGMLMKKRFRP